MNAQSAEKDAIIAALLKRLEWERKRPLPTIPIGTRVQVRNVGVGTVVGRDRLGCDGLVVIFDEPAPRGYEDGCCTNPDACTVLVTPSGKGGA